MLGRIRKRTREIGNSRQNATALDHARQENKDLRIFGSVAWAVEQGQGVDKRTQQRVFQHPALESGRGVFGADEGVFNELFNGLEKRYGKTEEEFRTVENYG